MAKLRGKEDYELGDLSIVIDNMVKEEVCTLTGKDEHVPNPNPSPSPSPNPSPNSNPDPPPTAKPYFNQVMLHCLLYLLMYGLLLGLLAAGYANYALVRPPLTLTLTLP